MSKMLRNVYVTGIGIVSSIGNDKDTVVKSMQNGSSGIVHMEDFQKMGLRSQVAGMVDISMYEKLPTNLTRCMNDASKYAYFATKSAIADAKLSGDEVTDSGIVVGVGGSSPQDFNYSLSSKKLNKRFGPFYVPRTMCSGAVANLSEKFKIKGPSFATTSACATSAHCIVMGSMLIEQGICERVIVGGAEEISWELASLFDEMRALSSGYNDTPKLSSRAFDKNRDGFVISGGSGILVLESEDEVRRRGVKPYCSLISYGMCSDGADMFAPNVDGLMRCMSMGIKGIDIKSIDYINTHSTSTKLGDIVESTAISNVFGNDAPFISGTKSMTGHGLGAGGAIEAILSILMMQNNFIAPSINVFELDEAIPALPIVMGEAKNCSLNTVLSNSFGFGGTNCTLVFRDVKE